MNRLDHHWYARSPWLLLLTPFSLLFRLAVALRRFAYRSGLLRTRKPDVPVIVVGNITVGGTGKTPLVAWLAESTSTADAGVACPLPSTNSSISPGTKPEPKTWKLVFWVSRITS